MQVRAGASACGGTRKQPKVAKIAKIAKAGGSRTVGANGGADWVGGTGDAGRAAAGSGGCGDGGVHKAQASKAMSHVVVRRAQPGNGARSRLIRPIRRTPSINAVSIPGSTSKSFRSTESASKVA
jgi:hypothetical protein